MNLWYTRPLTEEIRVERAALSLLRHLASEPMAKERFMDLIRTDPTITEPVRQPALELAPAYWERSGHQRRD